MPRNVRNFWLTLDVDGKKTRVATGPRSKDGGFNLTIKMRDNGEITKPITVDGFAREDGILTLVVRINDEYHTVKTQR